MDPIRCVSCGKVLNKWDEFSKLLQTKNPKTNKFYTTKEAYDIIGVKRYCCKRMIPTNPHTIDQVLDYENLIHQPLPNKYIQVHSQSVDKKNRVYNT